MPQPYQIVLWLCVIILVIILSELSTATSALLQKQPVFLSLEHGVTVSDSYNYNVTIPASALILN